MSTEPAAKRSASIPETPVVALAPSPDLVHPYDGDPAPTTLADVLAELKRIRHGLGLAQALSVGEKDLARLLGVSVATLARWKAAGKLLAGIRQGGRILYPLDGPNGVRAWLAAGMPSRRDWEQMQERRTNR